MDLVGNDVDTLHEEIKHLVGSLSEEWCGETLHEEKNPLVELSFIRVYIDNNCLSSNKHKICMDLSVYINKFVVYDFLYLKLLCANKNWYDI
jgi:hypothetical protein